MHKKTHSHQLSAFRVQLKKSHNAVIQARRGKDVILPSYVQLMLEEEKYPKETEVPVIMDANVPRKVSTQKKVSRYLDDYQVKLRLGRGAPATVDRLQKSLVVNECAKPTQSAAASTKNVAKRKSTMLLSAIKAAEVTKAEDFAKSRENMHNGLTNHHHYQNHKPHGHHPDPHKNEGKDESTAGGPEEELGYEPGTSIYFGATIALQVNELFSILLILYRSL